jgi:hypothetical protein
MKILYVGDHRDSYNWGGRGQSVALHQLLSRAFEITSTIPGASVLSTDANDGWIRTLAPQKLYRFMNRFRGKHPLIDGYLSLEKYLGAGDFVTEDPEKSAENLLRYKKKHRGLEELYNQILEAEALIINGEGSGIFTTPFRRDFFFYLAMMELGIGLGKKVFYLNGIISDCPFTGRNLKCFNAARKTLSKGNAVIVRDPQSLAFLRREMPEVKSEYLPDALFTWFPIYEKYGGSLPPNGDFIIPPPEEDWLLGKLDFSRPYICIGGSSSGALDQEKAVLYYSRLGDRLVELGLPVYFTQNCGGDRFLLHSARSTGLGIVPVLTPVFMAGAVLANARLFISGRFHATIFAALGGTPSVFLGAHSHKMASLMQTLEVDDPGPFSAFPSDEDLDGILDLARNCLREGNSRRERIKKVVAQRCAEATRLPEMIKSYL